uniref:Trans-golgi network integral membrane protein tgn38 n=1 Tax=Macrostomum lignano TaxID=282301 RepID=A0A1I8I1G7_9PLAT
AKASGEKSRHGDLPAKTAHHESRGEKEDKPESRGDDAARVEGRDSSSRDESRPNIRVGAHDAHPDDAHPAPAAGAGDHHYDSREEVRPAHRGSAADNEAAGASKSRHRDVEKPPQKQSARVDSEVEIRSGGPVNTDSKGSELRPPPPPPSYRRQPGPPRARPQDRPSRFKAIDDEEVDRQQSKVRFTSNTAGRFGDMGLLSYGGSSKMLAYFVLFILLAGLLYVVCHRKQKIIACLMEGRGSTAAHQSGRRSSSSRNLSGSYRRLPTEEELPKAPKQKPDSVQNFEE